jgi:soluble cytochrome b562
MKSSKVILVLIMGMALLATFPVAYAQKSETAPPPMSQQPTMLEHMKQIDSMLQHITKMVDRALQLSQNMTHLTQQKPGQMVEQYRLMQSTDDAMVQTLQRMKIAIQSYDNMMRNEVLLRSAQNQKDLAGFRDHMKNMMEETDSALTILEDMHKRIN